MTRAQCSKRCYPHTKGVGPETPPFFYEWCDACQAKKAAGKVRGDEGPVRDPRHHQRSKRIPQGRLDAVEAGRRKAKAANVMPFMRGAR